MPRPLEYVCLGGKIMETKVVIAVLSYRERGRIVLGGVGIVCTAVANEGL